MSFTLFLRAFLSIATPPASDSRPTRPEWSLLTFHLSFFFFFYFLVTFRFAYTRVTNERCTLRPTFIFFLSASSTSLLFFPRYQKVIRPNHPYGRYHMRVFSFERNWIHVVHPRIRTVSLHFRLNRDSTNGVSCVFFFLLVLFFFFSFFPFLFLFLSFTEEKSVPFVHLLKSSPPSSVDRLGV